MRAQKKVFWKSFGVAHCIRCKNNKCPLLSRHTPGFTSASTCIPCGLVGIRCIVSAANEIRGKSFRFLSLASDSWRRLSPAQLQLYRRAPTHKVTDGTNSRLRLRRSPTMSTMPQLIVPNNLKRVETYLFLLAGATTRMCTYWMFVLCFRYFLSSLSSSHWL